MNGQFFDIHCHALNLSHPNLLPLIKRSLWQLLAMTIPRFSSLFSLFGTHRFRNLFSIMENEIGNMFLITEFYLKNKGVVQNGVLTIDNKSYHTIVLTPLLMDFSSNENLWGDIYYKIPPKKPIEEQILDILNGIKTYCTCELIEKSRGQYEIQLRASRPIFEMYPFLGINPKYYTIKEIVSKIHKYFGGYSGSYDALQANFGMFNGNLESLGSNYFAGIKVYPPTGFDPWPEADRGELKKVLLLYQYCCDKNIPLTSHCSQIGFNVDTKNVDVYTSPKRWQQVLKHFPSLRLNLAHLGEQRDFLYLVKNNEWRDEIIRLIEDYPHVYSDISYRAVHDNFYKCLKKVIGGNQRVRNRILFGSDFLINLLQIDSYNDYIDIFKKTAWLTTDDKDLFASTNPRRFLFAQDSL